MASDFEKVRDLAISIGYEPAREIPEEGVLIIDRPDEGLSNLLLDVEDGVLVIEQLLFTLPRRETNSLVRLLRINRELVHGALALDNDSDRVIFRDTQEVENLDANELEASINALSLLMAEEEDTLRALAHGDEVAA